MKLQNDFTTPEQSKRLLELGVPADSANCFYTQENIEGNMYWFNLNIKREYQPHSDLHSSITWRETLPCWSVGQLMKIFSIVNTYELSKFDKRDFTITIEKMMRDFKVAHKEHMLDFSKLED